MKKTTIIPAVFFAALATSISGTAYADETPQTSQSECIYSKTTDYTQSKLSDFCFTIPENYTNDKITSEKQLIQLDENFNIEQYAQENNLNDETVKLLHLLQQDKTVLLNENDFIELTKVENINPDEKIETIDINTLPWDNINILDDNIDEYLKNDQEKTENDVNNEKATNNTVDNTIVDETAKVDETDTKTDNEVQAEATDQTITPRIQTFNATMSNTPVTEIPVNAPIPAENTQVTPLDNTAPVDNTDGDDSVSNTGVSAPVENPAPTDPAVSSDNSTKDIYGYPKNDSYGTGTDDTVTSTNPNTNVETPKDTETDSIAKDNATVEPQTATKENEEKNISYDTGSPISNTNTTIAVVAGLLALSLLGFGTVTLQRIKK